EVATLLVDEHGGHAGQEQRARREHGAWKVAHAPRSVKRGGGAVALCWRTEADMTDWDARYREQGWAFGTEPNDFLREQADQLPPGRVLCLAEGQGRNAVWLAQRGYDVTAMDQSAVGLRDASRLAA